MESESDNKCFSAKHVSFQEVFINKAMKNNRDTPVILNLGGQFHGS